MKASALPTLAQLSPAGRVRRKRRALRRDPYGLHPTLTEVDGRPIRSLSAGHVREHPEVVLLAGLGAPTVAPLIRSAMVDRAEDQVQRLTMPSVVITGRHDGFAPPAWARHLAELASAAYVILPGAHNGCFPHAQGADRALQSFVDQRLVADQRGRVE